MTSACVFGWFILWTTLVCGATMAVGPRRASAQAPPLAGVVVLRNGNVLTGVVRRNGDSYRVEVDDASFQIPASQVETFFQSLDEAYEARRRECEASSIDARLELVRWCLRMKMSDEAARELLDARSMGQNHPALAGLEVQVQQLTAQELVSRQRDAQVDNRRSLPGDSGDSAGAAPVRDIGADARAEFVRSIQPMLIRSCALGGCHQPGASHSMQLDRWAFFGNGNADLIQQNLAAVLEQVNWTDPEASPLFQLSRQVHGRDAGMPSRPLTSHQAELLLKWLQHATGVTPVFEAPDNGAVESSLQGPLWRGAPVFQGVNAGGTGGNAPAQAPFGSDQTHSGAVANEETSGITARDQERFEPRDPFDPEIFNRRHRRRTEPDWSGAGGGEHAHEDGARSTEAMAKDPHPLSAAHPPD